MGVLRAPEVGLVMTLQTATQHEINTHSEAIRLLGAIVAMRKMASSKGTGGQTAEVFARFGPTSASPSPSPRLFARVVSLV
jgi:hypothetical protein